MVNRSLLRIATRMMRFFFYLIYQPMAWAYDMVAWTVSLGRWKDWVLGVLPYLDGGRVLELGHGPGYLQLALAEKGFHSYGFDLSHQMGRRARRKLLKYGYAQLLARGRSQALPFPSATFGSVVSTFPSEYIYHPDTLAEVQRVLVPCGHFVIAPLAWITGKSFPDRTARWLFRVTGEAPDWNDRWLQPFLNAGFLLKARHYIEVRDSQVLVLIFAPGS